MRTSAILLAATLLLAAAPAEAQKSSIDAQLKTKVTLNFRGTRLGLALKSIQEAAEVNLALDPSVDATQPVTASASDITVRKLLNDIQKQVGLERSPWSGAFYLHPQGAAPKEPKAPEGENAVLRQVLSRVRAVQFERSRLDEVITRLKNRSKMKFKPMSFGVRKHVRSTGAFVTLRLWNARLSEILNHVCRQAGLTWKLEGDQVVFSAARKGEEIGGPSVTIDDYDVTKGDKFDKERKADIGKLVRQLGHVEMRGTAIRLLIREGKLACGPVAAVLKDDDAEVATQEAALQVLAEIGDPSEYTTVLGLFKNSESLRLRTAAGETLGAMKAPEAVPALVEALGDKWFKISETARQSLVAIGSPAVGELVAAYKRELQTDKGRDGILYRALLIFGEIGDKTCKRALLDAIKTSRGSRAVPIRHHAAIGLGTTDDVRLVEPLIKALKKERDFRVAKYIARSLSWITDHNAGTSGDRWEIWWRLEGKKKLLSRQSTDDVLDSVAGGAVKLTYDEKGLAVLESDEQRLTRLTTWLGDKDPKRRRTAWRDLESMGDVALPALRKTLKSGNPKARANAKAIIARIEVRDALPD